MLATGKSLAAGAIGGLLLFAGGLDAANNASDVVDLFDFSAATATTAARHTVRTSILFLLVVINIYPSSRCVVNMLRLECTYM
eukprot:COSAG05_NODE_138_length_16837_cov_344.961286_8_plen_83_part_00